VENRETGGVAAYMTLYRNTSNSPYRLVYGEGAVLEVQPDAVVDLPPEVAAIVEVHPDIRRILVKVEPSPLELLQSRIEKLEFTVVELTERIEKLEKAVRL